MKIKKPGYFLLLLILILGCSKQNEEFIPQINSEDPHTFSNFNEAAVRHIDFDLNVDFTQKKVYGKAVYTLENISGTDKLILDTRNLLIEKITLGEDEQHAEYSLSKPDSVFGQALKINILPDTKTVNIYYSTTEGAESLQWLQPENTAGGKYPFLYNDSQPILSRTWFPCQDSPGVRQTYTARIKTMSGLMVVMSGKNSTEKNAEGVYEITMNQPVPSYLIALAVGDFEYRKLGPRSGVYAESYILEKAAKEFEDTEKFIDAAESLYGQYKWEDYNMLVMPPSYPLGGMENPRINFITPTIIAGDKSLMALVAHELAHSWSGNLVTNKNWNDLWLNEGFTSYFEHRIMEEIYGRTYERMLAKLDQDGLYHVVERLKGKEELTKLNLNLTGLNPEGNAGLVAYDKGTSFLMLVEETVGREKFDEFMKKYFDEFAFKTMTSEGFVKYLRDNLIKGDKSLEEKIKIDEWVYGTGIPNNIVKINSGEFAKVEKEANDFLNGEKASLLNTNNWTTHHWLYFIRTLPFELTETQMKNLDEAFNFTNTGNYEVLHSWLLRGIHNNYQPAKPAVKKFLTTVGRTKFLRPLYNKLAETPEGLKTAKEIYESTKQIYHATSKQRIEEIFKAAN